MKETLLTLPDGRNLSFLEGGPEDGAPVLFFHGFGASKQAIPHDTSTLFEKGVRLIAIDRPGTGGSSIKENFTIQDFARDVDFLIQEKKYKTVSLFGWSAGGLYALSYAALFPEKIKNIALVSSAIPLNDKNASLFLPSNWKVVIFTNKYLPFFSKRFLRKQAQGFIQNPDKFFKALLSQMRGTDKKMAADPVLKIQLLKSATEGYAHEGMGIFYDTTALCKSVYSSLDTINVPVTIWQGAEDIIWTIKTSGYLKDNIKNSTLKIVKGAGHLLYFSEWEAILSEIRN